jgi:hypothetical protein
VVTPDLGTVKEFQDLTIQESHSKLTPLPCLASQSSVDSASQLGLGTRSSNHEGLLDRHF